MTGRGFPNRSSPRGVKAPDAALLRAESVTLAFLVLLEKLSPEERAVFLLRITVTGAW